MTQLRLAYSSSNPTSPDLKKLSPKLRMSRVSWSKLPSISKKVTELHAKEPAAAAVIEKLVDDALRRVAG